MTLVFMSLLATTIGERVSTYAGKVLLVPLLAMGAGSVLIWRASGDLRLYCMVQFGAMIAVPVMLILFPARYSAAGHVWFTVLLYGLAKAAEVLDHRMAAVILIGRPSVEAPRGGIGDVLLRERSRLPAAAGVLSG